MEIPVVSLWMSPLSRQSYDFLTNFKNYATQFNDTIEFYPVMRFQNILRERRKQGATHFTKNYLISHCYDRGVYCSQGNYENRMIEKPTLVLDEAIRQTCIYDLNRHQFYRYIEQYASNCLDEVESGEFFKIEECTFSLRFKLFNATFSEEVEKCFKESFVDKTQNSRYLSPNKILSKYRFLYLDSPNAKVPTFLIGRFAIRVKNFFIKKFF